MAVGKAAELKFIEKQAAIVKECIREDKAKVFALRMKTADNEAVLQAQRLEFD